MSTEMRKYIDTFKQRLTESENLNISDVRSSENELLRKILYLSNTDYCQSAEDMQYALEDINELIKKYFPDLEENAD
jgi:hypothetical protein